MLKASSTDKWILGTPAWRGYAVTFDATLTQVSASLLTVADGYEGTQKSFSVTNTATAAVPNNYTFKLWVQNLYNSSIVKWSKIGFGLSCVVIGVYIIIGGWSTGV